MILLTDGMPTDDYKRSLEKLKENRWFKAGVKVAVAIGDKDTNVDVLAEFTGNVEAVFTVHTTDQLKHIIRTVSVTASQVASQSASVSVSASGAPADAQSHSRKQKHQRVKPKTWDPVMENDLAEIGDEQIHGI